MLKPWDQCGGASGLCQQPNCKDVAWPDKGCPAKHACMRVDKFYWQCKPMSLVQQQLAVALAAAQAAAASKPAPSQANATVAGAAAAVGSGSASSEWSIACSADMLTC